MRPVLALAFAVGVGCAAKPAPPPVVTSESASSRPLRLTNRGLGPISKKTRVTLTSLRKLLAPEGLTVRPEFEQSLSFDVYKGDAKLFYVVGNDDGSMLYVHALSPQVKIEPHPSWSPGSVFYDDDHLSHCDCWGTTSVCWATGEHVAVGFSRSCGGLETQRGRRALAGVTIARVIWSPTPFERDEPVGGESDLFGVPIDDAP